MTLLQRRWQGVQNNSVISKYGKILETDDDKMWLSPNFTINEKSIILPYCCEILIIGLSHENPDNNVEVSQK